MRTAILAAALACIAAGPAQAKKLFCVTKSAAVCSRQDAEVNCGKNLLPPESFTVDIAAKTVTLCMTGNCLDPMRVAVGRTYSIDGKAATRGTLTVTAQGDKAFPLFIAIGLDRTPHPFTAVSVGTSIEVSDGIEMGLCNGDPLEPWDLPWPDPPPIGTAVPGGGQ